MVSKKNPVCLCLLTVCLFSHPSGQEVYALSYSSLVVIQGHRNRCVFIIIFWRLWLGQHVPFSVSPKLAKYGQNKYSLHGGIKEGLRRFKCGDPSVHFV